MQFEPGSSDTADALKTALEDSTRRISMLLEFDWNRDGQYAHAYSNLSDIATSVTVDRQATPNVPEAVQTFTAYSSGELTVNLHGRRDASEDYVHQQFSPWWRTSLIYSKEVVGTPIKYSRVVHTALGDVTVRQFTGWIRSFQIKRDDSSVEVTGSDALDAMNAPITLPTWARSEFSGTAVDPTAPPQDDAAGQSRPIELGWVVEEALRQAGSPTGPVAHPNAVAYWSCNGSFLPSVGTINDSYIDPYYAHSIRWQNVPAFQNGKYGVEPTRSGVTPNQEFDRRKNIGLAVSPKAIPLPVDGGPSNQILGFNAWVRTTTNQPVGWGGLPSEANNYRHLQIRHSYVVRGGLVTIAGSQMPPEPEFATSYFANNPYLWGARVTIFEDGTGFISVQGPQTVGTSMVSLAQWGFETPLSQVGHHYFDIRLTINSNGTPDLDRVLVDGSPVTVTPWIIDRKSFVSAASLGWSAAVPGNGAAEFRRNFSVMYTGLSCSHVQVYSGEASEVEANDARWNPLGHPPTIEDGRPKAVLPSGSFADCTWIPPTYRRPAWDVLQELSTAEMSILYVDELGTKRFIGNSVARQIRDANLSRVSELGLVISDERLLGFVVHPTEDLYRNAVSVGYSERWAKYGVMWSPGDWKNYITVDGTDPLLVIGIDDLIAVSCGVWFNLGDPQYGGYPRDWTMSDREIYAAFRGVPPEDSNGDISDERWGYVHGMQMRFGHSADNKPEIYWRRLANNLRYQESSGGAVKSANAIQFTAKPDTKAAISSLSGESWNVNMWIPGWTLGETLSGTILVQNDEEVSKVGAKTLELPENQWRSWRGSPNNGDGSYGIAESMLQDLVTPAPVVDSIDVPADPRLQLLDVVSLESEGGITGRIFAQVEGLTRTDTKDSFTDTITARIIETPGQWLLGTSSLSELGQTTILG